jgi:hypothetical protein
MIAGASPGSFGLFEAGTTKKRAEKARQILYGKKQAPNDGCFHFISYY